MDQRIDGVLGRQRRAGHREVGPGRNQPGAGRQILAGGAQPVDQRDREIAARTIATDRDAIGRHALPAQEAPGGQRILMRGRIGVLGREPVTDRQRPHARRAAGFRHHPAVTDNRAGTIAATVEEHQDARGVAAGSQRPFAAHAIAIDVLKLHIVGHRPHRADLIEPLAPLRPPHRPRLRTQQGPDGIDLVLGQGVSSRGKNPLSRTHHNADAAPPAPGVLICVKIRPAPAATRPLAHWVNAGPIPARQQLETL